MHRPCHFNRRHRFRLAVVMLLCFLFQQVAMAAYVCTAPTAPIQTAMTVDDCAAMGMTATSTDTVGHHTADARCADHCAGNASSTTDTRLPTVPPLLASTIFTLALVDTAQACHEANVPDRALLRPEPPPALRFCSLLI
jgi:hypothetical protein